MNIKENIENVKERIALAAKRSGRNPEDVLLIAVSKTYPAEDILKALDCGITDIGENKVQEMCEKKPQLPESTRIHLIGHLQTNKVKQALKNACMIHSVDSLHLAREISRIAVREGIDAEILLQVNVARDGAKFGFDEDELERALAEISTLPGVKVRGLMTVPAIETDPETTRGYFKEMNRLFKAYKNTGYSNISMDYLSMGMSGDFEIAVEEGANMVRVGSLIFGARNYNV